MGPRLERRVALGTWPPGRTRPGRFRTPNFVSDVEHAVPVASTFIQI